MARPKDHLGSGRSAPPQWIPRATDLAGIGLALAVGLLATGLMRVLPPSPYLSEVLLALVVGALVLNTPLRRLVGLALPSLEREPDRYAAGLRFTGKWVLRAGIILLGFKVQAHHFGSRELLLIGGVLVATLPGTFLIVHSLGLVLGQRRALGDLLAGGTMICGASAINAVAPLCGARREDQGVAIGAIFLFSVVALLIFRPIAFGLGLDPASAGIWSGLAVNDLSSAVAVGAQMGEAGGVMAAASKSSRVLMLAPLLVFMALLRSPKGPREAKKGALDALPHFLLGYIGLAVARLVGDSVLGNHPAWTALVKLDGLLVGVAMGTVSAGIGLHLELGRLWAAGPAALLVGGVASAWQSGVSLLLVVLVTRGQVAGAALAGVASLMAVALAFRLTHAGQAVRRALIRRFEAGAPLSLAETMRLLDAFEAEAAALDAPLLERVMSQLHPSIGELIPVRESPLPHGEGCRWMTYWEGQSGWALVAVAREPGSETPIHVHGHPLIGKAIEGVLEELRFREPAPGKLEVVDRRLLAHNEMVKTGPLEGIHVVRVVGQSPAIDLQLRGPESGSPGRRYRPRSAVTTADLVAGTQLPVDVEIDDRPGQAGQGAAEGRLPTPPG